VTLRGNPKKNETVAWNVNRRAVASYNAGGTRVKDLMLFGDLE